MPARIMGIVFDDVNSSGTFQPGEPGIPGAIVILEGPNGNCTSATTDASGEYSFDNLTIPGDYNIFETVTDPGATCPPTTFTQPVGFDGSTTQRQINLTITVNDINNNILFGNNNFGHDALGSFNCPAFGLELTAPQATPSELFAIDLFLRTSTSLGITVPSENVNAIGFNMLDGNIYGWSTTSLRLVRISQDNTVVKLPVVENLPLLVYFIGDVNEDGYYYVTTGSLDRFFVVDVNPNRATYGRLVDPNNGFQEQTTAPFGVLLSAPLQSADWAFNPNDGFIYSFNGNTGIMRRVDPFTGVLTNLNTNPIFQLGGVGGALFDNNNNIYIFENANGGVYQYVISGNNATGSFFLQSVPNQTIDVARCASAPIVFVEFDPADKNVDREFADVGDTLTYTIILNNIGNTTDNNVVFLDTIPSGTTFVGGSLVVNGNSIAGSPNPPGVNIGDLGRGVSTITFNVVVDTIPTSNPIENIASLTYTFTDPLTGDILQGGANTTIATTTVVNANITASKSVDKPFSVVGDTLTYTVVLQNTGNVTATNVVFSDTIPANTTYILNSFTENGVVIPGANPPNGVNVSNIPPNGTTTLTFQVTINTLPSPNTIINSGDVSWNYTVDPNMPNGSSGRNTSNEITTIVNEADLDITKIADLQNATIEDTITYTILITNKGNVQANSVVFSDTIPNGTEFIQNSVVENGVLRPGTNPQVGVLLNDIQSGATTTVTFEVTVVTIPNPNPIQNSGDVSWTFTSDPNNPNAEDRRDTSNTVETEINLAFLDLNKSVDKVNADLGDTLTYTIILTNSGNVTATNVIFSDTIPDGMTFVPNTVNVNGVLQPGINLQFGVAVPPIAPSASATVAFIVTVDTVLNQNLISNFGDATWSFTVDPNDPNGEDGRNTSNTVNTTIRNAILDMTKSVDKEFVDIGDTLTFTVRIENTGTVAANNVVFTDTIPNDTTFVANSVFVDGVNLPGENPEVGFNIGAIMQGAAKTVTFSVTVDTLPSPNTIINSAVTNFTYTVDPANPNGETGSNISNETTSEVNRAVISNDDGGLVKLVDKASAKFGDTLTYTIVMTNTGNVDANNITFSDTIPNDTTYVENSLTLNGSTIPGINPENGVDIGSLAPGEVATVTFQVAVDTLPSPNPIPNSAIVDYEYTVDPSIPNGASDTQESNIVKTQVNIARISNADGGLDKIVNKESTFIGDTITYAIVLNNTGNTNANNVVLTDTIPNDTTFVENSVTINGVTQLGANPEAGIDVGTVEPGSTTTVTFQVTVDTLPSPNPIVNSTLINYEYTVDPSVPNGASDEELSNETETQINDANISNADGGLVKSVDKDFADLGDTLTFTIVLRNTGNVLANNVVLSDTIPEGTSLVSNSVTVNGITQPGVNPEVGVNLGVINPNQVVTVTFRVVVDTLPSINPVRNSADVSYTFTADPNNQDGESERNTSNETETQINTASISNEDGGLVKSADKDFAFVGDTITYTIVLRNTGNVSANNVVFSDTIPDNTTLVMNSLTINGVVQPAQSPQNGVDIGTIAPNAVVTITFKVVVDEVPISNVVENEGNVEFTYTVDPNNPKGVSDSQTSNRVETTINNADISVDGNGLLKEVDKENAGVGDTITFTITLTNTGNVSANNVVVNDTIPNDTVFVENSVTINDISQPGSNPEEGINVGTLLPNQTSIVRFQVVVETIPSPNPITNIADVSYTFTADPANPDGEERRNPSNETETFINFASISNADGGLVKAVDKDFAEIGETITYTIVLQNTGNTDANNVVLSDTIPDGTSFIEDSITVNGASRPGENPQSGVNLGTVAPNQVVTVTFMVLVESIPSVNPVPNSADVAYTFTGDPANPDGESERNTSNEVETQINTAIISPEDDGFTKSVDLEFVKVGETLTYTIVAMNTGNVNATKVVISDTIPNGTSFIEDSVIVNGTVREGVNPEDGISIGTIEPGETVTVTFQVLVETIPSPNMVENSASIEFNFTVDPANPDGGEGGSTTPPTESEVNDADITPQKSGDKEFADIGDTITYTIVAKNTGNVVANNVIITDTIPNGTTLVPNSVTINGAVQPVANPEAGVELGSINPGATKVVVFTVLVEEIPTLNPIVNQAVIDYTFTKDPNNPDGESESGNSEEVETKINSAIISNEDGGLVKSADQNFVEVGDTITYTIVLQNTGNTDANNVVLSDTIPEGARFLPETVRINGSQSPGSNPENGINIGTISPGQVITVSFIIVVDTIPSSGTLKNEAIVSYTYTVDPENPDGESEENISNRVTTDVNDAIIDNESGGLIKDADLDFADIGDTITYTIRIENKGNVPATNSVFTDSVPDGTTFVENSLTINGTPQIGANPNNGVSIGTINPGVVVTVTFQVVVDEVPEENPIRNVGQIDYTFTKDPNNPDGPPVEEENNSNETETEIRNADLDGATKESDLEFAKIGDTITYTFNIPNSGNVPAENVVLRDSIPNEVSFINGTASVNGIPKPEENPESGINIGTINPGESATVTFQVRVESIPENDVVENQGNITFQYVVDPNELPLDGESDTNIDDFEVRDANINSEDGGLIKIANPEFAELGDTITFTIILRNTGNIDANRVVFSDTIPENTTFVEDSLSVNGENIPSRNPQNGINIGTIEPKGIVTITFQVTVETIPEDNTIENIGRVNYEFVVNPNEPPVKEEDESDPAIVTVNSVDFGGDNFTKNVEPDFAALGDTLTYTFVIRNGGNIEATDVILTDTIPSGTELIPDSVTINGTVRPNVNPESGIVLGDIEPEEVVTVTFQVTVVSIPEVNPIKNVGRLDFTSIINPNNPPVQGTEFSNEEETRINSADVIIVKKSEPEAAAVGEEVTYTLTIVNSGNTTAMNLVITDDLAPELQLIEGSIEVNGEFDPTADLSLGILIGDLGPQEEATVTYRSILNDLPESGEVENIARGTFDFIVNPNKPPRQMQVESNVNTLFARRAELFVEKIADKERLILNEIITYRATVRNVGNLVAFNVIFKDNLPKGLMFIPNSLTVNGRVINGANVRIGINLGNLSPGKDAVIEYKAKLVNAPCEGIIVNEAFAEFLYRASSNSPIIRKTSNTASVTTEVALINFKQIIEDGILVISGNKPPVEDINEIVATVQITNHRVIRTMKGTSSGNQKLSGYKLVVSGKINFDVEYTAESEKQPVHMCNFERRFSNYIVLPEEFIETSAINVEAEVEDVSFNLLNDREVFTSVSMIVVAKALW